MGSTRPPLVLANARLQQVADLIRDDYQVPTEVLERFAALVAKEAVADATEAAEACFDTAGHFFY